MIRTIKEIHQCDVVFVKIGKFYHTYGKDSYIISYFFGYQLKKVENTVLNCWRSGRNKENNLLKYKKMI